MFRIECGKKEIIIYVYVWVNLDIYITLCIFLIFLENNKNDF